MALSNAMEQEKMERLERDSRLEAARAMLALGAASGTSTTAVAHDAAPQTPPISGLTISPGDHTDKKVDAKSAYIVNYVNLINGADTDCHLLALDALVNIIPKGEQEVFNILQYDWDYYLSQNDKNNISMIMKNPGGFLRRMKIVICDEPVTPSATSHSAMSPAIAPFPEMSLDLQKSPVSLSKLASRTVTVSPLSPRKAVILRSPPKNRVSKRAWTGPKLNPSGINLAPIFHGWKGYELRTLSLIMSRILRDDIQKLCNIDWSMKLNEINLVRGIEEFGCQKRTEQELFDIIQHHEFEGHIACLGIRDWMKFGDMLRCTMEKHPGVSIKDEFRKTVDNAIPYKPESEKDYIANGGSPLDIFKNALNDSTPKIVPMVVNGRIHVVDRFEGHLVSKYFARP